MFPLKWLIMLSLINLFVPTLMHLILHFIALYFVLELWNAFNSINNVC